MLTKEMIQLAGTLKKQLERGYIDVNQIKAFLQQIEGYGPRQKPNELYDHYMQNLSKNKHSNKP